MSKQAQLQELRRAQHAVAIQRTRRRRILTWVGALVIVGLIGAITVAVIQAAGRERPLPDVAGKVVVPQHLTPTGAIPVGAADAPVTVEIYFDYMCPACGAFESANSGELSRLVSDGTARIELRPMWPFDVEEDPTAREEREAAERDRRSEPAVGA